MQVGAIAGCDEVAEQSRENALVAKVHDEVELSNTSCVKFGIFGSGCMRIFEPVSFVICCIRTERRID